MTVPEGGRGATRWVAFDKVAGVWVLYSLAVRQLCQGYGEEGVHSREAADRTEEEKV